MSFQQEIERVSSHETLDRTIINSVPATSRTSPIHDLFDGFSPSMKNANRTVNRMLSLSTGTTTDAGPVWSAW